MIAPSDTPSMAALILRGSMASVASTLTSKTFDRSADVSSASVMRLSLFAPTPGSVRLTVRVPASWIPLLFVTAGSSCSRTWRKSPNVPVTSGLSSAAETARVASGAASSTR